MLSFTIHVLLLLSPIVWVSVIALVVGACRSAARADAQPSGLRPVPRASERDGVLS